MKLLLVPALPTVSPPIVMVKLLPEAMLAPDVVMVMRLLLLVAAKVVDSPGTLQESMVGVTPVA
jgi:hypothetical protein